MSFKKILQVIRIGLSTSGNLKEYPTCSILYALSKGYNENKPAYLSIGPGTQTRRIYMQTDVKTNDSLEKYAKKIVELIELYGGELSFDFLLKVPPKEVISIIGMQEHAVDYKELYDGFIREMQNMCAGDIRKLKNFFLTVADSEIVKINLNGTHPIKPTIESRFLAPKVVQKVVGETDGRIPADKLIEEYNSILADIEKHNGILVNLEEFVRILAKKEIKLTIDGEKLTLERYLYNIIYGNNTSIRMTQVQKSISRTSQLKQEKREPSEEQSA